MIIQVLYNLLTYFPEHLINYAHSDATFQAKTHLIRDLDPSEVETSHDSVI